MRSGLGLGGVGLIFNTTCFECIASCYMLFGSVSLSAIVFEVNPKMALAVAAGQTLAGKGVGRKVAEKGRAEVEVAS